MSTNPMVEVMRDFIAAVRALPVWLADGCDRWVMDWHTFVDGLEDIEPVPCRACRKDWPCDHWTNAADRLMDRHREGPRRQTDPNPFPMIRLWGRG